MNRFLTFAFLLIGTAVSFRSLAQDAPAQSPEITDATPPANAALPPPPAAPLPPTAPVPPEPPSPEVTRKIAPLTNGPKFRTRNRADLRVRAERSRLPVYPESVTIGSDLAVPAGQTNGETIVIAGNVEVNGAIRGDLIIVGGSGSLGPKSEVSGDVTVVGGFLEADPDSQVHGEKFLIGSPPFVSGVPFLRDWFRAGLMKARLLPHQFKWSWLVAAGVLAFYLALAAVFPRPIEAAQNVLAERPGGSIMTGVLAIMLVVPLTLLLVLSVVGTVVVPFLACGFLTAFWLGKAAVYRMVGQQLGRNTGLACLQNPVVAVAAGVIIFLVVATIPFLGFIAWGALAPLAIGSVLLAAFPRSKPRLETPATPIPPVIPGVPAPLHPVPASSALLPRAGFWWRTFGTLLDFVILVAILKILRFPKPVGIFIPIWLIYQLALWTWNGATVGGLILGMRIIRTDGLSIGFPVALVRLLSSFLSALAFFLGFFWAGWDGQKQSWHDKIAGTLVVRTPRVARQVAT